jgi:coenzyme F420-reducing hydrogenase delta subunit
MAEGKEIWISSVGKAIRDRKKYTIRAGFMDSRTLKIYVFYCSNNLEQNQLAGVCGEPDGITVKTIGLPCSGKIDIPYLVKAFETGAVGVAIVSCKQSECRHLEGSLRAQKRAEAVESLLEEIGMGKGRIAVIELEKDSIEKALAEIRDFFGRVKKLPQAQSGSTSLTTGSNV